LLYPGKHSLKLNKENNNFTAELEVEYER
jgi:hypothetical protein